MSSFGFWVSAFIAYNIACCVCASTGPDLGGWGWGGGGHIFRVYSSCTNRGLFWFWRPGVRDTPGMFAGIACCKPL